MATTPMESTMVRNPMKRPAAVTGTRSPYPVVVMVVMAQYMPVSTLSNFSGCTGCSTSYMSTLAVTVSSASTMNAAIISWRRFSNTREMERRPRM